jgi:hypothetical protein
MGPKSRALHAILLDGVCALDDAGAPVFHPLPSLDTEDVADMLQVVRIRTPECSAPPPSCARWSPPATRPTTGPARCVAPSVSTTRHRVRSARRATPSEHTPDVATAERTPGAADVPPTAARKCVCGSSGACSVGRDDHRRCSAPVGEGSLPPPRCPQTSFSDSPATAVQSAEVISPPLVLPTRLAQHRQYRDQKS